VNDDAVSLASTVTAVQANQIVARDNRLLPRAAFAEDTSRDNALIAWLMSPATQSRRELRADAFSNLLIENGSDDDEHQWDNALNIAFATLRAVPSGQIDPEDSADHGRDRK
jgi:hypothetical protein